MADDAAATQAALDAALGADLVVICGGVSVGEHDHVRPSLQALGVEQVFWRRGPAPRQRPPTSASGRARRPAPLVFGLPGNPVSAMVTFLLFARPAIAAMLGRADERPRAHATLGSEHPARRRRTQLVRCRLELTDDGWMAHPTGAQGSHVLTSMIGADALAILPPADEPFPAG